MGYAHHQVVTFLNSGWIIGVLTGVISGVIVGKFFDSISKRRERVRLLIDMINELLSIFHMTQKARETEDFSKLRDFIETYDFSIYQKYYIMDDHAIAVREAFSTIAQLSNLIAEVDKSDFNNQLVIDLETELRNNYVELTKFRRQLRETLL